MASYDWAQWIRDELARLEPEGKSRSGLAAQLAKHRSAVWKLIHGERDLDADDLLNAVVYFGRLPPVLEKIAGKRSDGIPAVSVVGRIAQGVWYEAGVMQTTRRVGGVLGGPDTQIAYDVDGLAGIDIVIAVPGSERQPGKTVVVKRSKSGLASLTLARVGAKGELVSLYPDVGVVDGTVIAMVIETRCAR